MTRRNEHGQPVGDPVPDWTARERPRPTTLEGRFVRLEPLDARNAEELLARLARHPALWTYLGDEPPTDVPQAAVRMAEAARERGEVVFVVVRSSDDSVHGTCRLMRTDETNGVTEVGAIAYTPELQRTPATTEATYLLARHVFDDLGYRRLEWKLDSLNEPSAAAARRLGFTEEGTFRNALVYKGRNRDTRWFSIIDVEWPAIRHRLDAWLHPDNFGSDGRQHRSLRELA
ncbi:GNAT family protein [Nocardioides sp.]|uniref:GNAT family N-acetyltransferase n=1 Tax=Nocardioides sp. TaxID=35761 RepID=UPI002ED2C394